ncbi:unnamed protein product [Ambrosiozyma monospora]|uniref:Unnamed protein product n=1 Tax=Ambrosiozyma monospora TaxID=43982 RepID=A0ACB5U1W6_AMBMO|nr:unnamed protein product [Ambrosiozyma monospora]
MFGNKDVSPSYIYRRVSSMSLPIPGANAKTRSGKNFQKFCLLLVISSMLMLMFLISGSGTSLNDYELIPHPASKEALDHLIGESKSDQNNNNVTTSTGGLATHAKQPKLDISSGDAYFHRFIAKFIKHYLANKQTIPHPERTEINGNGKTHIPNVEIST